MNYGGMNKNAKLEHTMFVIDILPARLDVRL